MRKRERGAGSAGLEHVELPGARAGSSRLTPARLVALIGSVLLGVAIALAAMPWVFRRTPTDVSRIGVLLEALGDAQRERPQFAVFGNSVIMSGIDARQLRETLPGHPLTWNLASTGQSLVEASLLTQASPDSLQRVLYTLELRPKGDEAPLVSQKFNTFYMNGFRPSPETIDTLGRIYGSGLRSLLTRPHLAQLFEARWAVRQLVDTQLRVLLRRDLTLASAEADLLHPQRYTSQVPPPVLQRFLEARLHALEGSQPALPDAERALAVALAEQAAKRGRRTVFLFPPIHPALLERHAAAYQQAALELSAFLEAQPETLVIDATRSLSAEQFIDDLHPTNAGAEILTELVAERIARDS